MRKIATAVLSLLFFAAGAQAKDMTGVVALSGKVIIPIKYKSIRPVGDWLFVCEGFNSPPGVVSPKLPSVPLSGLSAKEVGMAQLQGEMAHIPQATTFLFDKYGKPVSAKIPAGMVLYDVHIPNKYQMFEPVAKLPPDTLITVVGKNGFGIVDGNGTIVIEPKYRSVGHMTNTYVGLRSVGETERKLNGDKFDLDLPFQRSLQKETAEGQAALVPHEGLVRFSEKGLFGFKDATGKVKIPAKYYAAREFSGGYAPVRLNPFSEDGRYVYIDHNGKPASKEYFRAYPFVGKTAIIAMFSQNCQTFGLIDNKFATLIDAYCHEITRMKDGSAVPTLGTVTKVFDKNGKPVFDLGYNRALVNNGEEGLVFRSPAGKGKELRETLDTTGKVIKSVTVDVPDRSVHEFYDADTSERPDGTRVTTLKTFDGRKTLIEPTEDDLYVAFNNLLIRTIHSKTFSKDDWNGPDSNRARAFQIFRQKCKPVGMTRTEVEKYLGKGKDEGKDAISYDLAPNGFRAPLGVIRFKDGKVESIDVLHAYVSRNGVEMPNPQARMIPIKVESKSGFKYPAFLDATPDKETGKPKGTVHIRL